MSANIEYSFAAEIAKEDYSVITECKIFKDWLEATTKHFVVSKIHFESVRKSTLRSLSS